MTPPITSRRVPGALSLLLILVCSVPALAAACGGDDDEAGIRITGPSARAAETGSSAVYFRIVNSGDTADRLIAAATDAAAITQLHETVIDGSVARMELLEAGIPVPPNGEVVLRPGGLHVMLLELTSPLVAGSELTLTLTFEHAGELTITVPVQTMPGMDMEGHS